MQRRKLLVTLAGLAVLLSAATFVLWPRLDRVTRENFDRLQLGMSRAEVETILGPPGSSTTGPIARCWGKAQAHLGDVGELSKLEPGIVVKGSEFRWSDTGDIILIYGASGTLIVGTHIPMEREPQGPLDNFLWRAKRQWRKWFHK